MLHKFPKQAASKWNRFTNIEKWLLVFYVILIAMFLYFPVFEIWDISNSSLQPHQYTLFNKYMLRTWVLTILSLLFLLLWNWSFRFKKMIHTIVWFKENDALLNFIVLWFISYSMISSIDTIKFVQDNVSQTIRVSPSFYVVLVALIVGLLANLILALTYAKARKKNQIVNISKQTDKDEREKEREIRWLFE